MIKNGSKIVLVAVMALASCGLSLAQEKDGTLSKTSVQRELLLKTLSETVAKLKELNRQGERDVANQYTQQVLQLLQMEIKDGADEKRTGNWRPTDATWSWELQNNVRENPDALLRYGQLRDAYAEAAVEVDAIQPSPFWIGVQCEPVESYELQVADVHVVTAQGGLRVNAVTAASPALKAGVKVDDVIALFNDTQLSEIDQLVKSIGENGEKPARLTVVRDKKFIKMSLTPAPRENVVAVDNTAAEGANQEFGMLIDLGVQTRTLPESYKAVVEYERGNPVVVKVSKGTDTWQATNENVEELPGEVQGFANHVLEQTGTLVKPGSEISGLLTGRYTAVTENAARGYWDVSNGNVQVPGMPWRSFKKLEAIEKHLKELQIAVEDLKKE